MNVQSLQHAIIYLSIFWIHYIHIFIPCTLEPRLYQCIPKIVIIHTYYFLWTLYNVTMQHIHIIGFCAPRRQVINTFHNQAVATSEACLFPLGISPSIPYSKIASTFQKNLQKSTWALKSKLLVHAIALSQPALHHSHTRKEIQISKSAKTNKKLHHSTFQQP